MVGYPELVYSLPINGQKDFPTGSMIELDWSTDLDLSFVSNNTNISKKLILVNEETNVVIPLTYFSYTPSNKRLTLSLSSPLNGSSRYRLVIRAGIKDSSGRSSIMDNTVYFTTASVGLEKVLLIGPAAGSLLPANPPYTFSWSPTTASTGLLGVGYDVNFYEGGVSIGSFTTTQTSLVLSTGSFESVLGSLVGRTMSWDVTARSNVAITGTVYSSAPSEKRTIIFDRALADLDASPETNRIYEFDEFDVTKPLSVEDFFPSNQSTNLTSLPTIQITFTQPITTGALSNYFSVTRKDQLPRNDIPESYLEFAVSGTWSVSGTVATFTPSDTNYSNSRFTVRVKAGLPSFNGLLVLAEEYVSQFSSQYYPYYVDIRLIKSQLRSETNTISDDLINYYIHMASLEANARYQAFLLQIPSIQSFGDSLQETYVRNNPSNIKGFGVLKWTAAKTLYDIYSSILIDELRNVGRKRKLGDYEESLSKDFLEAIKQAKQEALDQMEYWNQFLTPGGGVGIGGRMRTDLDFSIWTDPSMDYSEIWRGTNF